MQYQGAIVGACADGRLSNEVWMCLIWASEYATT